MGYMENFKLVDIQNLKFKNRFLGRLNFIFIKSGSYNAIFGTGIFGIRIYIVFI